MAEFDHGIKIIASTTGRQLARLAGVESQAWSPLESTLQATTELLADRVFLARQGSERFVVYFEFYTTWDRDAPWDVLAKSGLLSRREKLPTRCLLFILRKAGYKEQGGQLRLAVGGEPTQHLWFREVPLWGLDPEPWWEEVPGLMALYPLCRHGRKPRDAVRHAAAAIEERLVDPGARADGLYLLNIFGGLAYPRLDIEGLIGREKMRESKVYRAAVEEGELKRQRTAILQVLRARFGPEVSAEFAAPLDALPSLERMEPLLDVAATCAHPEDFRAALGALPASP
jgi:hypothetical protein